MNADDDAYLAGVHSPRAWSSVLYWVAGFVLAGTVLLCGGLLINAGGRISDEELASPDGLNQLIGYGLVCGGMVSTFLLAGLAVLLRWAARTVESGVRATVRLPE